MSEEFIREVDEELKEEKYSKLWKKIGPYVISFAAGIVLFTTGVVGWNSYSEKKKQMLGDDFTAAVDLIKEDDVDTALIALERITDKASDGYVTMAKMKKAANEHIINKNDQSPLDTDVPDTHFLKAKDSDDVPTFNFSKWFKINSDETLIYRNIIA